MAEFDWMESRPTRNSQKGTQETRADEIGRRAALFAHLGYPKKRAEARLKANLAWEHDGLGSALIAKKVSSLLSQAYQKVTPPKSKKKK